MRELEEVRAAAGTCPSCGAGLARPIVWGMPDFADVERWGYDVAFGGCCIPASPAAFSCAACGVEWGHFSVADERPDQGAGLRPSQPAHSEDP